MPMSQSAGAGTFGFAPAWGVRHSSSLLTSEGGSSSIFGFAPAYAWGVCHSPSLLISEGGSTVTVHEDIRPIRQGAPSSWQGFPRGFLGGRLQARHCGSAQACSGINVHNYHGPTTPVGTTLPSSPSYAVAMTRPSRAHTSRSCSGRLEDVECGRHKPLKSRIGPRLYTTSLRLHQRRLNPSTWRRGTTPRLPLPAHNAGDSSRPPDEGDAGRLSISTRTAFFYFRGGLVFN